MVRYGKGAILDWLLLLILVLLLHSVYAPAKTGRGNPCYFSLFSDGTRINGRQ